MLTGGTEYGLGVTSDQSSLEQDLVHKIPSSQTKVLGGSKC